MLNETQRRLLFETVSRTCTLWADTFSALASATAEEEETFTPGLEEPAAPAQKPLQEPLAEISSTPTIDILTRRAPGAVPEGYLTMSESMSLTGYRRDLLMRMVKQGTIRSTRGGGDIRPRYYLHQDDIQAILEEQETCRMTVRSVVAGQPITYPNTGNGRSKSA